MTVGSDILLYEKCLEKTQKLGIKISVFDDVFILKLNDNTMLGKATTVNDVYNYLCGYETGFSNGFCHGMTKAGKKVRVGEHNG